MKTLKNNELLHNTHCSTDITKDATNSFPQDSGLLNDCSIKTEKNYGSAAFDGVDDGVYPWNSSKEPYWEADVIISALDNIYPEEWALIGLADKKPVSYGWQSSGGIDRDDLVSGLTDGVVLTGKLGSYRKYLSGVGLLTGDFSDGIVAVDVDGTSAVPILEALSDGNLPESVSWSSGKKGRRQIAYQVPAEHREALQNFNKIALKEFGEIKASGNEQLEIRYNRMQSVLPPSRHPDTGEYFWINSPENMPVADAPKWLIDLMLANVTEPKKSSSGVSKGFGQKERKEYSPGSSTAGDLVDFLENQVLPALDVLQIFNWEGHNFVAHGETLKGYPYGRESSGGESFHVWHDGSHWAWQDKLTGVGGGAIQYRWMLKGGTGTPTGKDFVQIVKELASDAGFELPKFSPKQIDEVTPVDALLDAKFSPEEISEDTSKERYQTLCRKTAQFAFTRTPDLTQDPTTGYLPELNINDVPSGIVAYKGGCGSGKSHHLANLKKQLAAAASKAVRVLQVANLNGLLQNTSKRFDLMHHQEAKSLGLPLDAVPELAITDISLALMLDVVNTAPVDILIVDEVEQVLSSLLFNSNLRGVLRLQAWLKVCHMIRTATYVMIADADLSDFILDLLEQIRGDGKKAFILHHTEVKSKGDLHLTSNKGLFLGQIEEAFSKDKNTVIFCETKSDLKTLEKKYQELDFITFHGDNSQEAKKQTEIQNIDSVYLQHKSMGFTKTLGTGIDLSVKHYNSRFAFLTGDVSPANEQIQGIERYRPQVDSLVYLPETTRFFDINPEKIYQEKLSQITDIKNLSNNIQNLIDEGFLPSLSKELLPDQELFLRAYSFVLARRNASLGNPKGCFIDRATSEGYNIIDIDGIEKTAEHKNQETSHKNSKKEIRETEDKAIAAAKTISKFEAETLRAKQGQQTLDERYQLAKYRLKDILGIEITTEIVQLDRKKKLSASLKNLQLLFSDDSTASALEAYDRLRNPLAPDRSYPMARRTLLQTLGVTLFIQKIQEPGFSYTKDHPEVKTLALSMRANAKELKKYGICTVSSAKDSKGNFKQSDAELVNRLLDYLGIYTKTSQVSSTRIPENATPPSSPPRELCEVRYLGISVPFYYVHQ
jgi:Bifunctional DNA primase/polymerase, N-terminal